MMEEVARSNKDGGRVPPQDVVAEKSLLGAIMINDGVMPEILTILRPQDFYEKQHEIIFSAMAKLYDKHKPTWTCKCNTRSFIKIYSF